MGILRAAGVATAAALVVLLGCGDDGVASPPAVTDREPAPTTGPPAAEPEPPAAEPELDLDPEPEADRVPRRIELRIDRRVADPATAGFEQVVVDTLTDPQGWPRAGVEFAFGDDAPYVVVLAEGDEVDELCHPYRTGARFSCQNGPVVALNADRWREATPQWTGDLDGYRQMLVNHEVGHLLGEHHPAEHCPGPGQPAPVMAQQSTNLGDCLPNPWPLDWEIGCLVQHPGPIAPPYDPDPQRRCGPDGPVS